MIEREFVEQRKREYQSQEFISKSLKNVGHSHTKLQKTPLGEKITIFTSRPGLVVGRKGQNISKLTKALKEEFNFENPQIEISEVENVNLDAAIVAERIASAMERFGVRRFKGVMHKAMEDVMKDGALGVEILVSGKLPSSRSRRWRVYDGYLKKCGDIAQKSVDRAKVTAKLRSGIVGVQVSIMLKDRGVVDPARKDSTKETVEESKEEKKEDAAQESKETKEEPKKESKDAEGNKGTERSK